MSKLITIKDRITGEEVYPTIPVNSAIDETGSNILGVVEKKLDVLQNNVNQVKSSSITLLGKIKTNPELSNKEKRLSAQVNQIHQNNQNLNLLKDAQTTITSNLSVDNISKDDDIYTTEDVMRSEEIILESRSYLTFDKVPKYAPKGRRILIGEDGYLYIGINKVWYKSNKPLIIN